MEEIAASIIIPTYNKLSRLKLVLKTLEPQITQGIEVIIVFDGCSEEVILEFQKLSFSFDPIPVILKQNVGRSCARNKGLSLARGKVIIFLDDDRLVEKDFLKKHIAYHDKEPCVVLGERMDLNYSEEAITALMHEHSIKEILRQIKKDSKKEFYYNIKKIFLKTPYNSLRYIAFITGNVSIDRNVLIEIQGFDEAFKGWGYEDTDLGYRLMLMNIPYISDLSIVCYHILHSHVRGQKSKEELRNLKYFKEKFKTDHKLKSILRLYQLKAALRL
jgi:GT2 family glycosyltransferase